MSLERVGHPRSATLARLASLIAVVAVVAGTAMTGLVTQAAPAGADTGSQLGGFVANAGRLLDTRQSTPLAANTSREIQVTGQFGVPSTGVTAAVVTLTAINATTTGNLWVASQPRVPILEC